jgi:UDP-N-acetylenolpyruvoylglucosamine reductase
MGEPALARRRRRRPRLEPASRRTRASTRWSSSSVESSPRSRPRDMLRVGGGAANAVALHRARAAGLGSFEFACAIPGARSAAVSG